MVTITLELPDEARQALDEIAERSGRSPAELVQEAVREFLDRQNGERDDPGWPRSIGMIDDPELSAADLDEWLKANWRPEDDWGQP